MDYIVQRHDHPYIPGADVPEFNYLSPTRRKTGAVHHIGGDNLPVVIAARLDGDMDFNPQFMPDYIYTGRSIPRQLPEGMQCIIDADVWMEHSNGGTEPDNAWPAFKGDQLPFLSSCGASLKFLFITYMGLNRRSHRLPEVSSGSRISFTKQSPQPIGRTTRPGTPNDEGRPEKPGSIL